MKIVYPSGRTVDYLARNPVLKYFVYDGDSIAPHGTTDRFTYTVPTGKILAITGANIIVLRKQVATTLGKVQAWLIITKLANYVYPLNIYFLDNNVGAYQHQNISGPIYVTEGITLKGQTSDSSTAGSMFYGLNVVGFEFDA